MMLFPCPWCGERAESEFICLGEAVQPRPRDPAALTDLQWAAYLCDRENRRGPHLERWWHIRGCNSFFEVVRDTATHAVSIPEGAR